MNSVQGSLQPTDEVVATILPALKTFPTNEVAIIGCHCTSLARRSCEYDLLVITRDPIPEKFVNVGGSFAEILFRNERDLRQPSSELALALASAVPLRDNSLLLASAMADSVRNYGVNCASWMEEHLASSLKALGRVDALLASKNVRDADLWLLSAASDFAYAELLSNETVPAPSHILTQLKSVPRKRGVSFRAWSGGSGLELASRVSCENRLEALSVVYDVLRTSSMDKEDFQQLWRYKDADAFAALQLKAREMLGSMQSVECFAYLGQETVRSLLDLYSMHTTNLAKEKEFDSVVKELTTGKDRLISEEVVKSLGLVRTEEMISAASQEMKLAVSTLAKRT